MQKKKTAVPTYLGVAAVWIGSHFGPGFATGAFSVRWYVKYGWVGLVTPLLAMLITGGVMYFMLEYAREHGTPNYRPFARSCYGEKLGGVVAVLYDICFLMTMMCAGGLAFSGEGKLLQGFLGVNYWATAIVTILISAALCLYGSKLLAKSSGYMMYAIVGVVLLITVLALTCGDSDVPGAFANSAANAKDPQPPGRDPQRHAVRLFPVHHRLQRHVRLGRGEGQKRGAQGHRRGLSDHDPADGLPDLHAVQLYECL